MEVSNSHPVGKRIGIIGLGSIGIKHVSALQQLGVNEILAWRTGKGKKKLPSELKDFVKTIDSFADFEFVDGIIISNPTSAHEKTIENVLKFRKPIFIEKPLFDNPCKREEFLKILKNYQPKIQVGFCLRFNNVMRITKEIIENGQLGEIFHARLDVGQYLPLWHPYTDYRKEYFSKKILGGGALRTLSHEIDLVQYFFGNPTRIRSFIDHLSPLEIDVDDYSLLLLQFENKTVKIEIDFLQKKAKRKGIILGTEADLEYDVFNNRVSIYDKKGKLLKILEPDKNDMYQDQMRSWLSTEKNQIAASLDQSLYQLNIIEKAEYYSRNTKWMEI